MKKEQFVFRHATLSDLTNISEIEREFFSDYDKAFSYEFLKKWYIHNQKMFFVVESSAEGVVGFVILTPVSELLHRKIISGELYDLYDFPLSEVPKEEMRSEYYFVSDICLSKQKAYSYIQAVSKLLGNTLKIMWEKAKIVTACPVTQEGLKIDESIGMRKVAEAFHDGKKYPIHLIEVTQEGFSRFQRIISQA